jgi:hypothetical protein
VTSSLALSSDRHRLVLSYVWMLPQLSHAKPLVRRVGGSLEEEAPVALPYARKTKREHQDPSERLI